MSRHFLDSTESVQDSPGPYVYRVLYHDAGDRERSDCGWGRRVARSRNEICVTRGPTSPGLALLLLSSAQSSVQFYAREGWHVILFNYVIRVISHGPRCDWDREQIDRTNEERDGKRQRSPSLLSLRAGNSVFVNKYCLPL